jgi:hypothetical protein
MTDWDAHVAESWIHILCTQYPGDFSRYLYLKFTSDSFSFGFLYVRVTPQSLAVQWSRPQTSQENCASTCGWSWLTQVSTHRREWRRLKVRFQWWTDTNIRDTFKSALLSHVQNVKVPVSATLNQRTKDSIVTQLTIHRYHKLISRVVSLSSRVWLNSLSHGFDANYIFRQIICTKNTPDPSCVSFKIMLNGKSERTVIELWSGHECLTDLIAFIVNTVHLAK